MKALLSNLNLVKRDHFKGLVGKIAWLLKIVIMRSNLPIATNGYKTYKLKSSDSSH